MMRSLVMASIGSLHALFCPGPPSIACPLGSSNLHPLLRLFPTLSLTQGGISSLDLVLPLALPALALSKITFIPTGAALNIPVALLHPRTVPGKSLPQWVFRSGTLCYSTPSVNADSPGFLRTDCWIQHLHVHLSRVTVIF